MSTLKSTKKIYPKEYENGKVYYHNTNPEVKAICASYGQDFSSDYEMIKFFTESQKHYLDRRCTFAWAKTYLNAQFCELIIKLTGLADCIEHYAIIYHDMDTAKPHTHLLIKFYRNESYITRLIEYFHCDNVTDPSHKLKNCFNYLTHDSKECRKQGKYLYPKECIISDDIDYWECLPDNDIDYNVALSIIDDIRNNVTEYMLVKRYGREYVLYRDRYRNCARNVDCEEYKAKGMIRDDSVEGWDNE